MTKENEEIIGLTLLDEFISQNYGSVCGYSSDIDGGITKCYGRRNRGTPDYYSKLGEVLKEIQQRAKTLPTK